MSRIHEQGYIALISTLIVGAVSLSIAITMLLSGTASQQNSLSLQRSAQARAAADACAEEALEQINTNTSVTGTNSITVGSNSCSYTIASTGTSTRIITASATVGDVVRKVAVYVTIASSSISVTSWQEVS